MNTNIYQDYIYQNKRL